MIKSTNLVSFGIYRVYTGWPILVYPFLSPKIVEGRPDVANYFKNKKWHNLSFDSYFCFKISQNVNNK